MTTVIPTAIRRLETNWGLQNNIKEDHIENSPLPEFIPSTLFGELNLPEVELILPEIIQSNDKENENEDNMVQHEAYNNLTNNKYKNVKLNETALPIIDKREYKISNAPIRNNEDSNDHLIIFENEMYDDFLNHEKYKKIYFVLLDNEHRSVQLSTNVMDYKKNVIKSRLNEIKNKAEFLDGKSFTNFSKTSKSFDVIYPSIGENFSFLKRLIKNNDLHVNFVTRKEDEFCWKFSNKGYFNFKSNIPIILSTFKLN